MLPVTLSNVAGCLTASFRGPVLNLTASAPARVFERVGGGRGCGRNELVYQVAIFVLKISKRAKSSSRLDFV